MSRFPSIFVSHGSPMLALEDSPARRFLQELGQQWPRPRAVAVVSAHWESMGVPAVALTATPSTIHDFGGFPQALFDIQYPAPGAPEAAEQAAALLEQGGFRVSRSLQRGLDHGAWVPLRLMYPQADVPAFQISVLRGGSASEHAQLGAALTGLRDQGVLLLASGSLTHNLREVTWGEAQSPVIPDWVTEFADWMEDGLLHQRREDLLDYRKRAPHAVRNHPSDEHLMPLYVAWGAAGPHAQARRLHHSYEYGVLAMDAYQFD